jgi:5-methylcytosine-specific restriction endonuclease McrA
MPDVTPDPKPTRAPRKPYRRKVASRKQWEIIRAEKLGPCRVCTDPASNGHDFGLIQLYHLRPRAHGGDDVAANIVPLCPSCHGKVTRHDLRATALLMAALTDAERAYMERRR